MKNEHPYKKEYLEAPLRMHKYKLELLHKHIRLMPEGKTDYERNQVELEKLKTGAEIKALTNVIAEREAYYLNYFNNVFVKDLDDMQENLVELLNKAKNNPDKDVQDLVNKLSFEVKGPVNVELQMHLYKLLKKKLTELK